MSVKFTIIKDGREITVKDALKMTPLVFYDPLGFYNEKSPYYVAHVLNYLKRKGLIDDWKAEGEFPKIEYNPDVIY